MVNRKLQIVTRKIYVWILVWIKYPDKRFARVVNYRTKFHWVPFRLVRPVCFADGLSILAKLHYKMTDDVKLEFSEIKRMYTAQKKTHA